jgi:hypothetical protein
MAIKIKDEYAARANDPSSDYPTGSIKDRSAPGELDGTPLTAVFGNDIIGFTDALLASGGVAASGSPDTVIASDRLEALKMVSVIQASMGLLNRSNPVIYAAGLTVVAATDVIVARDGGELKIYLPLTSFTTNGTIATDVAGLKMVQFDLLDALTSLDASAITSGVLALARIPSHIHSIANVTGLQTALNAKKNITDVRTVVWSGEQFGTLTGFYMSEGKYEMQWHSQSGTTPATQFTSIIDIGSHVSDIQSTVSVCSQYMITLRNIPYLNKIISSGYNVSSGGTTTVYLYKLTKIT